MNDFSRRISGLSQKRLVLLATQLQSQLDKLERSRQEPIAVVGIGCRFPGGVQDPESYWQLLHGGVDAVTEIPTHRWDVDAYYDSDLRAPGKIATRWAALIDPIDQFDASFFGIAPREAHAMDPQQRILLETTWQALERAGLAADRLIGTQTGVFIGISGSDYYHLQLASGVTEIDAYFASGNAHSVASGRLSYILGLQGPCLSVDTACSSSLVALHLALQSLRNRECDTALAGGVNLILGPEITIALSKAEMMAPDGRCKTFDARANGFVRGEGCGILVLKRLADAIADNHNIMALIRGSAVNQDGKSNGLTAPNGPSQEAVISAALANAGVKAEEIGYVEAHGTGTSLGDPIEARALGAVFKRQRGEDATLWVGSAKTNIGHLESAAGIAGVIKAVVALQHEEIPPHLHFETPSPYIDWDSLPLRIPTQAVPWPTINGRRLAGISSFGFSGTNAHVIVEQAPPMEERPMVADRPSHLLTLSAKSREALQTITSRYISFLDGKRKPLADICYTANTGRAHFDYRIAVSAESIPDTVDALKSFSQKKSSRNLWFGRASRQKGAEIAFLFTGQGAQYRGMGMDLYAFHPRYRETIEQCNELLKPHLNCSLLSLIAADHDISAEAGDLLNQTRYTQPVLFALEYALAELWRSWGMEPTITMGHSLGEYVAACVSGLFSLEDGLKLVCERARLMQALPPGGTMVAVFADATVVEMLLTPFAGRLSVAAFNGPNNTVVSGGASDMAVVCQSLDASGIGYSQLTVSHAFHSHLMDPMMAEFERVVSQVDFHPPKIGIVSNLTGELEDFETLSDPVYWCRHTRQPVQFEASIKTMVQRAGCRLFIESGPHPVLCGMASRIIDSNDIRWLPSLRRGRNDWHQMIDSMAQLYINGFNLEWEAFDAPWPRRKIALPTYPFNRKRYWSGADLSIAKTSPAVDAEPWRQWVYEFAWKQLSSDDVQAGSPDYLPGPDALVQQVQSEVGDRMIETGIDVYDEFLPRLDHLCTVYVLKALNLLGVPFTPGERFDVALIAGRSGIQDQHYRLLERMFSILVEEKMLRRVGNGWEAVRKPDLTVDPEDIRRGLLEKFPNCGPELGLIGSCAGQIAEVMKGQADPMALLFPNGSMAMMEKMYHASPALRFYNSLIQRAFAMMAGQLPAGRGLRVLEIGAGTGGTTGFVLPELPAARTEYVFTDISELFLAQARDTFGQYPFLDYRLLDITSDPLAQGFGDKQYDIILAANVLHATPDIRKTLEHVRSLMAPKGMLILLEGIDYQRFSDLTVGLTKGWWHFTDEDLRPSYALIPVAAWHKVLAEAGFEQTSVIPADLPDKKSVLSQQAIIVARASATGPTGSRMKQGTTDTNWLIFSDDAGYGRQLVGHLQSEGGHCTVVQKGDAYRNLDAATLSIDPSNAAHYIQLVHQLSGSGGHSIHKIIYLWGMDAAFHPDSQTADLEIEHHRTCGGLLFLVQAIAGNPSLPVLSIVTKGSQAVVPGDNLTGLAQSPLWGLGRVIALEHPELKCLRLDLDQNADPQDVQPLLKVLVGDHGQEPQLAVRGGRCYALRVIQSSLTGGHDTAAPDVILPDAAYLVTGGMSGLGLEVARWMVGRGARYIALMGRSAPSEMALRAIADMEEEGARIVVVQGDVAEYKSCVKAFERIAEDRKPLRGIIHSAGTLDDGILLQLSWDRFRKVMRAKVDGSWNLHLLCKKIDLDFFILFSSGAAFLGSSGQGNHATANAFMDALAHYRRACGLSGLSINWGAWAEIGAAVRGDVIQRMQMKGMGLIQPMDGLGALGFLMGRRWAQRAVLPIAWPELFEVFGDSPEKRIFENFQKFVKQKPAQGHKRETVLPARIQKSSPAKRYEILFESVQEVACRCLGLDPDHSLDPNQPLNEVGLDSLMAVELRNTISTMVDAPLPATLLFNYPSLTELVRFLANDVLTLNFEESRRPLEQSQHAEASVEMEDIDNYSEEEMEKLLLDKLKDI